MKETLKQAMEANFPAGIPHRVDDIIVFRSLTKDDLKHIIDIELSKVIKRLKEKEPAPGDDRRGQGTDYREGHNTEYGARPLRRAIEHFLEDPLSEDLLRGSFVGKDTITVRVAQVDGEKKLTFETTMGCAAKRCRVGDRDQGGFSSLLFTFREVFRDTAAAATFTR